MSPSELEKYGIETVIKGWTDEQMAWLIAEAATRKITLSELIAVLALEGLIGPAPEIPPPKAPHLRMVK